MTAYTFKVYENAEQTRFHYTEYYGNTPDEAIEHGKADLKGTEWELGEIVEEEVVK